MKKEIEEKNTWEYYEFIQPGVEGWKSCTETKAKIIADKGVPVRKKK